MEKVFLWPNRLTTKPAGDRIKTTTKNNEKSITFNTYDGINNLDKFAFMQQARKTDCWQMENYLR